MPRYSSAERQLRHLKGFRVKTGRGLPKRNEGSDGELTLRLTKSGLKLLCKYGNKWYGVGDQSLQEAVSSDLDTAGTPSQGRTTIDSRTGNLNMAGTIAMAGASPRSGFTGYDIKTSTRLSSAINNTGLRSKGLRFTSIDSAYLQDIHMHLESNKRIYFDGSTATTYMTGTNTSLSTLVGGNTKISIDTSTTPDQVNIQNADMYLKATTISATGNDELIFLTQRGADGSIAAGQDNDDLGKIVFKGYNDAGTPELIEYGSILGEISDATDSQEAGKITVATGELELDLAGDMLIDVAGGDVKIQDNTSGDPTLTLISNQGGSSGPTVLLKLDSDSPHSTDTIGTVYFANNDDAGNNHYYASIISQSVDVANGGERGKLSINVAAESGTGGIILEGISNNRVDVNIGLGDASVTTIEGNLDIDGDTITIEGDLTVDSSGFIALDSHNGEFVAKRAGTEFSATNSAYAGMVLGYSNIFGSGTGGQFVSIGTAWENLLWDTDKYALVTFKLPPSNKVRISVHLPFVAAAGIAFQLGLATDSSATSLNAKYQNDVDDANRADSFNLNYSWTINGSDHSWSTGETKTVYIMSYAASTIRFYTGGTNAGSYGGVEVAAVALPATIGDGSEP